MGNSIDGQYTFTDLQIEVAKLKAQKYSYKQIAEILENKWKTKYDPANLTQALTRFRAEPARRIYKAFVELQEVKFWRWLFQETGGARQQALAALDIQRRGDAHAPGVPWFGKPNEILPGLRVGEGKKSEVHPEHAEIMNRVFRRIETGEVPLRVLVEELPKVGRKITRTIIRQGKRERILISVGSGYKYLRDPRYVKFGIVPQETFNNVQKILRAEKSIHPKFGLDRTGKVRGEMLKILQEICRLRADEDLSRPAIASKLGIKENNVQRVLGDKSYSSIVGNDLWDRAHRVHHTLGQEARKYLDDRSEEIKAEILTYLKQHGPSYGVQIAKETKHDIKTVLKHLHKFRTLRTPLVNQDLECKWFAI